MTELTAYRLKFHSGLHVGDRGMTLEESSVVVSSGTLFSALVAVARRMGQDPADIVAPFLAGEPPFLLTSAFPIAGEVRFFPLPIPLAHWFPPEVLRARRKGLKRIRFISEGILRLLLDNTPMASWLFPKDATAPPEKGVALHKGSFWLTQEEVSKLPPSLQVRRDSLHALWWHKVYAQDQVPRVTIDRIASTSNIFHAGRVRFNETCGLWFGIAWRTPQQTVGDQSLTFAELFRRALTLLGEDGLGGERSVGYGAFDWEEDGEIDLPAGQPDTPLLLLSRYHPREAELPATLMGKHAAYSLIPKGGWVQTWDDKAQRRRRLWLLTEGSVIQPSTAGPWGDLTDVRPNTGFPHPVWRYGLALGAALKEVHRA
jgi:CRISPR-associated protein Csm4